MTTGDEQDGPGDRMPAEAERQTTSAVPRASTPLVRHIAPVLAGAVITILLTVVTGVWLAARGAQPPLLLVAGYRAAFVLLGCYMAARLGPEGNPRIRYALALGVLVTLLNLLGAPAVWEQVPSWYVLSMIVLPVPLAVISGGVAARSAARLSR